jgi:hypothetical protein
VTCSGDPVAAVLDALLKQPIDQIVVCDPRRRLRPRQIDLAHRARRATGLPVIHAPVAPRSRRAPPMRLAAAMARLRCPLRTPCGPWALSFGHAA